ncbi:CTDP1 [Cordylochernes scorpioides]|uniref:protein-serine/threonine phosphatase n=1 Tax=Cordylochernes scorpioides TaxID=51811 RepID=A0ABY6L160_9ARAC|nr:CTDP1 [Cordylochernes scorpioides]
MGKNKTYKASIKGTVKQLVAKEGDIIKTGDELVELHAGCQHLTFFKDMCAECGAVLSELEIKITTHIAKTVSMVHSVPDLRVYQQEAESIGKEDTKSLLASRKLVLLVDLDQTLIHTTYHPVRAGIKNMFHFQLNGPHSPWFHTRVRPGTQDFLEKMSAMYELHICTFGTRPLRPHNRQTPRSFSQGPLPLRGCHGVYHRRQGGCVELRPHLVPVKPYIYFQHTGDINAPAASVANANNSRALRRKRRLSSSTEESDSDSSSNPTETSRANGAQPHNKIPKIVEVIEETDKETKNLEEPKSVEAESLSPDTEDTNDESKEASVSQEQLPSSMEVESPSQDTKSADSNGSTPENNVPEIEAKEGTVSDEPKETNVPVDQKAAAPMEVDSSSQETKSTDTNGSGVETKTGEVQKPASTEVGNQESAQSSEAQEEEDDDHDDYLLYLEDILTRVHTEFFKHYDEKNAPGTKQVIPDLKKLIPEIKKRVLKGARIMFSGVIPTNSRPEKNKLWYMAKQLGSEVVTELCPTNGQPSPTHLVAAKWGTAKVNRARDIPKLHLVTPYWLMCCAERWEHVDERFQQLLRRGTQLELAKSAEEERASKTDEVSSTTSSQDELANEYSSATTSKPDLGFFLDFSSDVLKEMGDEVMEHLDSDDSMDEDNPSQEGEDSDNSAEQDSDDSMEEGETNNHSKTHKVSGSNKRDFDPDEEVSSSSESFHSDDSNDIQDDLEIDTEYNIKIYESEED